MRILSAFPGVAFAPRCEGSRLATIRREAALVPTVGSGRPNFGGPNMLRTLLLLGEDYSSNHG